MEGRWQRGLNSLNGDAHEYQAITWTTTTPPGKPRAEFIPAYDDAVSVGMLSHDWDSEKGSGIPNTWEEPLRIFLAILAPVPAVARFVATVNSQKLPPWKPEFKPF